MAVNESERVGWNIPALRLISRSKDDRVKPAKPQTSIDAPTSRKLLKKRRKKPYHPRGVYWRENGAGFDLRRSSDDHYLAHLSRREWMAMKRKYRGRGLEAAIREWIKGKET